MRSALLSLILVAACSTDKPDGDVQEGSEEPGSGDTDDTSADDGGGEDTPTWHQDVAPVFARSCDGCHQSDGIGTPKWSSPEEVAEWATPIAATVGARTMPPWRASSECNTYIGDFSLTEEEVATVVAWAEGGAPIGDAATAAGLPAPYVPEQLDRVDLELRMPVAYEPVPTVGTDDYRCFLMEWPYDEKVWVTGYQMKPDNLQVVHHIIPFIISPDDVDQYRALDEADPGPGYGCYGGPGGDINTLINTRWLGSWAPGSAPGVFEDGVGLEIPPGGLVAFQVHYNVTDDAAHVDQSGIDLRVETERQGWAELQPWTEVAWLFGDGMDIPANTNDVTHTWEYAHRSRFTFRTAALHMHTLGKSAKLWVEHADGTEDCLIQVDNYDFNWQRSYQLAVPVETVPGDTLHLSCTWDNPTDDDAAWGDGTGDEMCLGISLITD